MARKLKTYTTSAGFFDLAVAAPSMKAALEAWGSTSNLFHQGFAQQSDDPKIVAATLKRPGVVLRRAVGSDAPFSEKAALPTSLPIGNAGRAPAASRPKRANASTPSKPTDDKAAREAALAYERERKRREREVRKEEAARERERARRDRAVAAAEAALESAGQAHEARVAKLEKARAALDRKAAAEETSWDHKKEQLERALRRARSPGHLRLV